MKRCVDFDEYEEMIDRIQELAKEVSGLIVSTKALNYFNDICATWTLTGILFSFCKTYLYIISEEDLLKEKIKIGDIAKHLVNVRYRRKDIQNEKELYGYARGVVEASLTMLLEDYIEVSYD